MTTQEIIQNKYHTVVLNEKLNMIIRLLAGEKAENMIDFVDKLAEKWLEQEMEHNEDEISTSKTH